MSIAHANYDYKTCVTFSTYLFPCDKMLAVYLPQLNRDKQASVFPGKMCLDRCKNHGCEQKKTERHQVCDNWHRDCCQMLQTQAVCWPSLLDAFSSRYFFLSLKLLYCQTIFLLNKLQLLKKPLFQKRDGHVMVMRCFPKPHCDFPPRKDSILLPPPGCLGTPLPSPSPYVRTGRRMLTSEPKFLASIGYQILVPMVLCYVCFSMGAPLSFDRWQFGWKNGIVIQKPHIKGLQRQQTVHSTMKIENFLFFIIARHVHVTLLI